VVLVGDGGGQGKLLLTAIRNIHIYWNGVQGRCLDWDCEAFGQLIFTGITEQ